MLIYVCMYIYILLYVKSIYIYLYIGGRERERDVYMFVYIYIHMSSRPLCIAFCGQYSGIMALFYLLYGPTRGANLDNVKQKMHGQICYQKAWMALGVFKQHIVVPTVFAQVFEVKVTWSQGTTWHNMFQNSGTVHIYIYIHTYIHTYIHAILNHPAETEKLPRSDLFVYLWQIYRHRKYFSIRATGFPPPPKKKGLKCFKTSEARTTKWRTFLPVDCIDRSLVVFGNLLVQCDAKTASKKDSDQVRHL